MANCIPRKIGFLIPEFPGQTHSFFWREIQIIRKDHNLNAEIISTRLPAQPVTHEWLKDADPHYLYPFSLKDCAFALFGFLRRVPKFLGHKDSWQVLHKPKSWALLVIATKLGRQCKALGIDHLHIHSCADSALLGVMCHRMYDLPYSLVLHGPFSDYGAYQNYKWRHAAFVFVITNLLYQEALNRMPDLADKIHIAPMGVDTSHFIPAQIPQADNFDGFTWFCCARLNKVKGFDTLLPAVKQLARDYPDLKFRLIIAGEDEQGGNGYRKVLECEIKAKNIEDKVALLGSVPQTKVLELMQSSDGFVLASKHEPLGVVYMEAMSCGLPTLGTDAGGVAELIDNGEDGLLVPPNEPDALAQMMHHVMISPQLRASLGQKGRRKIQRHFSSSRSAKLMSDILLNRHIE